MVAGSFRILIKSVGTAHASTSGAIAKGLGLPTSTVVSRLYSAPTILIDGIDESVALNMVRLLASIGYEAEAQDSAAPMPDKDSVLYDVAIYLKDGHQFQHVVQNLSNFTGTDEDAAAQMVLTPPGVVLGSVSRATVEALEKQLGDDVSVLTSQADNASYDIFLSDDSSIVPSRILQDIANEGLEILGDSGLVAANASYSVAQNLWRRHQASGLLRVVNQDFLRFDILLLPFEDQQVLSHTQIERLEALIGIPKDMAQEVLQAAPITLLESIPNQKVQKYLLDLAGTGLNVKANLITFQMLQLEILSITDIVAAKEILESFQLIKPEERVPSTPFHLPGAIPELQARIMRAALEDAGCEVLLSEVLQ